MKRLSVLISVVFFAPCFSYAFAPGDLNCDGAINVFDIDPFVLALTDPAGYAAAYPACDVLLADLNGDGTVNVFDIDPFVAALTGGEPQPIHRVELAGNPLSSYPYFEFVRAFNVDEPVGAAVDPNRYPDLVGQTVDMYVVAAKSAGEWSADPALDDVTPDGQETVTILGSTIQENIFVAAGANELNAHAGTGLGVGYDVVLDVNRNGVLDGGDYIDGYGSEAGLYVVHNTVQSGPLAVTEITYSGGTWLGQDTYYPTNIASMGKLPLVVVSHGNGHDYTWYDHIGYHLASYGCIVMSHTNNTGPGSETASGTTLTNTEYIIANQASIADGVLNGHIDSHRITFIGHSRGGEGVVRAYTKLRTGVWSSPHFSAEDVILVSSMAPVTHIEPASASTPFDVNYHMFIAGADSDVSGSPDSSNSKPLAFYERAYGNKQLDYIHGCGHAWLHAGPAEPSWAEGPDLIGQSAAHSVVKGYYLPLIKLYAENNLVARDFFARRYDHFRPIGIPGNVVVSNEYRDGVAAGNFVIDDYQTQTTPGTSSSGGAVSYTVQNLSEVLMQEQDGSFAWTGTQPSNGMTMYRFSGDDGHCVVFDWDTSGQRYYELEVVPEQRDFSDDTFLSFRACQGTRHPRTVALAGPLSFTVTLRDADGTTSSIDFGSFGHITRTYQRTGSGSGAGWANEFCTVRIRLTDFQTNGVPLDLTNIVAVRFDFGSGFGSSQGRIGLDDIELTGDYPPYFVPLTIRLVGTAPEFMAPGEPAILDVEINEGNDELVAGSPQAYYRYDGGPWLSTPLTLVSGEVWRATLPAPECGQTPEYYFAAEGLATGVVFAPGAGEAGPYSSHVGSLVMLLDDDFQSDLGWTVTSAAGMVSGMWQRAIPGGWDDGSPPADHDGSGRCYVTDNRSSFDVDGGPTQLMSPVLDLSATTGPVLRYAEWFTCDDPLPPAQDFLDVYLSSDDGATWVQVAHLPSHGGWVAHEVRIADYIPLTSTVRVLFTAQDVPNNSRTEAGIDAVSVFDVFCE